MRIIKKIVKSIKRKKMMETARIMSLSIVFGAAAGAVTTLLLTPRPKSINTSLNQVKEHVSGVVNTGRAKLDELIQVNKRKFKKL